MAKLALYQKYRSSTFDEVVGQEYIVQSIRNAVRENKVGHAYLFCGPRGTGKTTMARLLAKAVNCEHREIAPCEKCENCLAANAGTHPDIIEINAANETHVEDIRDLIDRSRLAPMQGKHKIYIIDEVHQLSSAASSALLKTLEEPPENVIFILATTDPQKLLPTIISRCQRFDFSKVRIDQIKNHLLNIAQKENIQLEDEAAMMIAVLSDGGMRDALSIMDQCASYTNDNITTESIHRIYGIASVEEKIQLLQDILNKDLASIVKRIKNYENSGIDFIRYTDSLIDIVKDIVIYDSTKTASLLRVLNEEQAKHLCTICDANTCLAICEKLIDVKNRFKTSTSAARVFEVVCLSLTVEQTKIVSRETIIQPQKKTEDKKIVVEEKPVPIKKVNRIEQSTILQILVACDKASKVSDENTFAMLESYDSLENRKYISVLKNVKVAASGKNCMLLVCQMQSVANRINDEKMNRELYFFMKNIMHTDKMLYAIQTDDFKEATSAFRNAMNSGALPEPIVVNRYEEQVQKEETSSLEKVKQLFGDDVEIV